MKQKLPKPVLTQEVLHQVYHDLQTMPFLTRRCPKCNQPVYVLGDTGEKEMLVSPCYDCLTK